MQVTKLSQQNQNNTSFSSRYKVPMSPSSVNLFEKCVVPLYRSFTGKPIKAYRSSEHLFVFTGKEDVALFTQKAPKKKGITVSEKQNKTFFDVVQHETSAAETFIFMKNFKNYNFGPIKNLKELVNKLLAE